MYNKITKQELRKQFYTWLGDEFDNQNKDSQGETHSWILCNDGNENVPYDCACCLTGEEHIEYDEKNDKWINKCGCHCHERITQIVDFFWNKLNINTKENK